ncbi:putative lipoprotein [Burkholderia pseudomallei]|nr:putative lipoprotein [Burkholderia pseudomallei]
MNTTNTPPKPSTVIASASHTCGCLSTRSSRLSAAPAASRRFGTSAATPANDATPSAATIQNVARQPSVWPTKVPNGTPSTFASVSPVNISAIALARLSALTSDAATTAPMPKNEPCANDVTTRATISIP